MANTKPLGLYDSCVSSPYSRSRERMYTAVGSQFVPTYKLTILNDGTHDFKETGKINIYEKIQSHRESVDLSLLIKRYEQGDETALERVRGFYVDTLGMPTTLAETLQRIEDSKALFASLPPDMRDEFNHNPDEFFVKLGDYVKSKEAPAPAPQEEKKDEVLDNE